MTRSHEPAPTAQRVNLLGLPRAELEAFVAQLGSKPFRARQLMNWLYKRGVGSLRGDDAIWRKDFRAQLGDARRGAPARDRQRAALQRRHLQVAAAGRCRQAFEMVYIPETDRGTLCISSQVGCALDCSFCSTAQQGFNRNLRPPRSSARCGWRNRELGRSQPLAASASSPTSC